MYYLLARRLPASINYDGALGALVCGVDVDKDAFGHQAEKSIGTEIFEVAESVLPNHPKDQLVVPRPILVDSTPENRTCSSLMP